MTVTPPVTDDPLRQAAEVVVPARLGRCCATHEVPSSVTVGDTWVFDVDGTLADVRDYRHLLDPNHPANASGKRDFPAFHQASTAAPPHEDVADLARHVHSGGAQVVVVTARPQRWENPTVWWLLLNGIPFDELHTRSDHDQRADRHVKGDILAALRRRHRVVAAVDDNPSVIGPTWCANDIPVAVVPGFTDPGASR